MNEHLQNLARRAGFVGTNFSNTVIGTDQETALKNFAELILGDCISTIKESAGSHLKSDATETDIKEIQLKVEGALAAMSAIANHFGVR